LIGAIDYLSSKGADSISFLTYNAGADGDNVWPFVARDDKFHYDVSKLDQWHPDAHCGIGKPEATRQNANHSPPCSIERHACADDRRIAAHFLPQTKAQYCDRLGPRDIIARTESAPEKGTHAKNVEELGGCTDRTY
jgi:hypothetical protein